MKKMLCLCVVLCLAIVCFACNKTDNGDSSSALPDSSSSSGGITQDLTALREAIENTGTNYKYVYNLDIRDPSGTTDPGYQIYYYDDGILKIETSDDDGNEFTDYLYYDYESDAYSYYYENDDGAYSVYDENSSLFSQLAGEVNMIFPEELQAEVFTQIAEGEYEVLPASLSNQADLFLGGTLDGEVYASLTVKIQDGRIQSVSVVSEVTVDNVSYYYTYEIVLSDFGRISLELPDVDNTDPSDNTISNAISAEDDTVVTAEGIVSGIVGNNFYLTDGIAGVYIYAGSTSLGVSTGDKVSVTGTKVTYNGLIEITSITSHTVISSANEIPTKSLNDLSDINKYLSMNVSFGALTIKSAPSWTATTTKDVKYTVTDGTSSCTLFISKYLSSSKKKELYSVMGSLKAGDVIYVRSAAISRYTTSSDTNGYQIAITESTSILTKEPEITGIESEDEIVKVYEGTLLENVAAKLTIYKKYSDNTTQIIKSEELELISENYDPAILSEYSITVKWKTYECVVVVKVIERPEAITKINLADVKTLNDIKNEKGYGSMPANGNARALVIPVEFTDYKAPSGIKEKLNTAFFGASGQTGWESLYSYYYKTSYGKLNISGTVTDVFNTGKKSSYYENIYSNDPNSAPEYEIIKAALEFFDGSIDYNDYDADGDGYIDALYIIYTAPVDYENADYWWAFTYEYFTETEEKYDGVEADFYTFLGYEFFDETLMDNTTKISINTETIIHESGHILGITDYYDYDADNGPAGGIGGGDMMDANVGDNNPFTKMLLGWAAPTLVQDSAEITLSSFGKTGECIILAKDWNGSVFGEYYVIDYYTPDGLNELEKGNVGLFSVDGIRIYHVDATLKNSSSEEYDGIWDIYSYDNSSTAHKLLSLVQANGRNNIETNNDYSSNKDLFTSGSVISGLKWYDGTSVDFTVTVSSISNGAATLSVSFN